MAVVIEMRPELYDRFWKRCELMGREYAILRNGLIVRRPKGEHGEHYERIIEISCEAADAKNLLAIAANICPDAVRPIEKALASLGAKLDCPGMTPAQVDLEGPLVKKHPDDKPRDN
jgi:hypothetical protein